MFVYCKISPPPHTSNLRSYALQYLFGSVLSADHGMCEIKTGKREEKKNWMRQTSDTKLQENV